MATPPPADLEAQLRRAPKHDRRALCIDVVRSAHAAIVALVGRPIGNEAARICRTDRLALFEAATRPQAHTTGLACIQLLRQAAAVYATTPTEPLPCPTEHLATAVAVHLYCWYWCCRADASPEFAAANWHLIAWWQYLPVALAIPLPASVWIGDSQLSAIIPFPEYTRRMRALQARASPKLPDDADLAILALPPGIAHEPDGARHLTRGMTGARMRAFVQALRPVANATDSGSCDLVDAQTLVMHSPTIALDIATTLARVLEALRDSSHVVVHVAVHTHFLRALCDLTHALQTQPALQQSAQYALGVLVEARAAQPGDIYCERMIDILSAGNATVSDALFIGAAAGHAHDVTVAPRPTTANVLSDPHRWRLPYAVTGAMINREARATAFARASPAEVQHMYALQARYVLDTWAEYRMYHRPLPAAYATALASLHVTKAELAAMENDARAQRVAHARLRVLRQTNSTMHAHEQELLRTLQRQHPEWSHDVVFAAARAVQLTNRDAYDIYVGEYSRPTGTDCAECGARCQTTGAQCGNMHGHRHTLCATCLASNVSRARTCALRCKHEHGDTALVVFDPVMVWRALGDATAMRLYGAQYVVGDDAELPDYLRPPARAPDDESHPVRLARLLAESRRCFVAPPCPACGVHDARPMWERVDDDGVYLCAGGVHRCCGICGKMVVNAGDGSMTRYAQDHVAMCIEHCGGRDAVRSHIVQRIARRVARYCVYDSTWTTDTWTRASAALRDAFANQYAQFELDASAV